MKNRTDSDSDFDSNYNDDSADDSYKKYYSSGINTTTVATVKTVLVI